MVGSLRRAEQRARSAAKLVQDLEAQLRLHQKKRAAVLTRLGELSIVVQSLDHSITLVHEGVDPAAAGVVIPWAGKYGRRGALKDFVRETLRSATGPIAGPVLAMLVAAHFQLTEVSPDEQRRLANSVRDALERIYRDEGLIEPIHDRSSGANMSVWQWCQPSGISDLQALALAIEGGSHEPNSDPSRTEMGAERAGGRGG